MNRGTQSRPVGPVVVIEDERDILDMLCDVLEFEGFLVLCLEEPQPPEHLRTAGQPCLFLIDIMLPGTNGIDVATALRQEAFAQTPMIAMSASPRLLTVAEQSGLFQAILPKPFTLDDIFGAIDRLLAAS